MTLCRNVRDIYHLCSDLFCTKEGAPKQRLKLNALDQPEPYMFQLTSPAAIAVAELATFKRLILEVITQNQNLSKSVIGAAPTTPTMTSPSSTPAATPKVTPPTRASPAPAHSRASSAGPSKGQAYSFEVYQKVLTTIPELASLHRDLVEGGQITEAEFWEGREVRIILFMILLGKYLTILDVKHLLAAEFAAANQRKGKPSEIVVPRLKTGEQGQILLTLTPQLLSDIFEEFPIVQQAYSENVPKPASSLLSYIEGLSS
jgi:transcription initiation factor TFIIH subunit 1